MGGMTVYVHGHTQDPAMFRALSEKMIAFVRDEEPGTLQYEWHVGPDGTCLNIDGYDSTESFLTHMGHVQELGFLDQYMETVEIQRVVVTGQPTKAADPLIEQFGAEVLEFVGSA